MKTNAEIVLSALLTGIPVEIDGQTYLWQDGCLSIPAKKYKLVDNQMSKFADIFLPVDIPLSHFVNMCERITEDEMGLITSNLVLTKSRRRNHVPIEERFSQNGEDARGAQS